MTLVRAALLAAVVALACTGTAVADSTVQPGKPVSYDLWPGPPPGGGGPSGPERVGQTGTGVGAVSNVSKPRIEVYKPASPNGAAVVIVGGGGYFRIGIGHEVMPTARWLAALGVTPVVLYYRLPADRWPAVAPFQDAQRAIRLVRAHAQELGIDPKRVGVLGFSAGGNLAGIAETRFAAAFYPAVDASDTLSARPDFAGLIYPVVSLRTPFDTTRSFRELSTQGDAVQAYSVELHVTHDTPPTFLAQAADDPIANVGNSLVMFDALRKNDVDAELHVFDKGGHGWGLGDPGSAPSAWPRLFAAWARRHGFFSAVDASPFANPAASTPIGSAPAASPDDAGNDDDNN
ncbi:Acetyl esterase/lipase [Luteibacter sp. UNC138MFCol5.1]|uniref:alpha/beta hydrolase n=1 Tax=Luteibacter sp. UNC138MFCol5.1 TaxID=1502774 RepID=UPI0008B0639C|nr:alpha/beta hydrolase [Luteibacter sp. UNC138MFCol5.1]SEO93571.1 Acetyl esterase/lipase [Luteibacter sp. UNC138MFCol5.1]